MEILLSCSLFQTRMLHLESVALSSDNNLKKKKHLHQIVVLRLNKQHVTEADRQFKKALNGVCYFTLFQCQ